MKLCSRCKKDMPATRTYKTCEDCVRHTTQLRGLLRSKGLCLRCRKTPARLGKQCCEACAEKYRMEARTRFQKDPKEAIARTKRSYLRLKHLVYTAYGSKCACCGESDWRFLTVDHVLGDGAKQRRAFGTTDKTSATWRWARDNNFPPTLQILCYNCNCASYRNNGICPHKDPK